MRRGTVAGSPAFIRLDDGKFEEMFLAPSGGDTLYDYSPDEVTPKAGIYLLKMPKSLLK